MIYPLLCLVFHLSITLGSIANSNLDFQADEPLSEPLSGPVLAEPNTALAVETQAESQNSRITGKPSRQWKKAPVPGELYKDTDLCGIAHPWPMCATMEVRRVDDSLSIPLNDFSGRWEDDYCRPCT